MADFQVLAEARAKMADFLNWTSSLLVRKSSSNDADLPKTCTSQCSTHCCVVGDVDKEESRNLPNLKSCELNSTNNIVSEGRSDDSHSEGSTDTGTSE